MPNDTIMTSRRGVVLSSLSLGLAALFPLTACSPQFNWRQVTDEDGLWLCQFPGKPASLTRSIRLQTPTGGFPIRLRLVAARIGGLQYTIGTALLNRQDEQGSESQSGEVSVPASAANLELVRLGLEEAMLKNIASDAGERSQAPAEQGRVVRHRLSAQGRILLEANGEPVPARLRMETVVLQDRVIEAVVAGPETEFLDEAVSPFFEAFRPGVEMYRPG